MFDHFIFKYLFITVNVSSLTRLLWKFLTCFAQLSFSKSAVCLSFPFLCFYLNKLKCSFAHLYCIHCSTFKKNMIVILLNLLFSLRLMIVKYLKYFIQERWRRKSRLKKAYEIVRCEMYVFNFFLLMANGGIWKYVFNLMYIWLCISSKIPNIDLCWHNILYHMW